MTAAFEKEDQIPRFGIDRKAHSAPFQSSYRKRYGSNRRGRRPAHTGEPLVTLKSPVGLSTTRMTGKHGSQAFESNYSAMRKYI
jgi:hypothetical protein